MYDLVCIGISLVDCIIKGFEHKPFSSGHYLAKSSTLSVGGEAYNQSITGAKLGLNTAILSAIGNDFAGELIINQLKNNGVDCSKCVKNDDINTPVSTLIVNDDGTRNSIMNDAQRYNFHPEKYLDILNETKAISLGSLFRAPFDEPEIIYSVLSTAKKLNVVRYVDTKIPNFKNINLDDIKDSLALIDYIFPNYDEAKYLTNETDYLKQADVLLSYGIKNVIIKLGDKGCYFKNDKEEYKLDPLKVNVVDTSGAGDNFIAGFISCKNDGMNNLQALEFANKCGALACEHIGATGAINSRQEVLDRFGDK